MALSGIPRRWLWSRIAKDEKEYVPWPPAPACVCLAGGIALQRHGSMKEAASVRENKQ